MGNHESHHPRPNYLDDSGFSPDSGHGDEFVGIDAVIAEGRSAVDELNQRIAANENRIAALEQGMVENASHVEDNVEEFHRNLEELRSQLDGYNARLAGNERRVRALAELVPRVANAIGRVGQPAPSQPNAQNVEAAGQQQNLNFREGEMAPEYRRVFIGPRRQCPRCNKELSVSTVARHLRQPICPRRGRVRGSSAGIRIENVWSQSPHYDPQA